MGTPLLAIVAFGAVIALVIAVFIWSLWLHKIPTALASLGAIILVANLGLTVLGDEAWADYWVGQSATIGGDKPQMAAWGIMPQGVFDTLAVIGTLLIAAAAVLVIVRAIRTRRTQREDRIRLEQVKVEGGAKLPRPVSS